MSRKRKKTKQYNDNTAFSKADWFGPSRKSRQSKRKTRKTDFQKPHKNKGFITTSTSEEIEFVPEEMPLVTGSVGTSGK